MRLRMSIGTEIRLLYSYERNLKLTDAPFSNITKFFSHMCCVS